MPVKYQQRICARCHKRIALHPLVRCARCREIANAKQREYQRAYRKSKKQQNTTSA